MACGEASANTRRWHHRLTVPRLTTLTCRQTIYRLLQRSRPGQACKPRASASHDPVPSPCGACLTPHRAHPPPTREKAARFNDPARSGGKPAGKPQPARDTVPPPPGSAQAPPRPPPTLRQMIRQIVGDRARSGVREASQHPAQTHRLTGHHQTSPRSHADKRFARIIQRHRQVGRHEAWEAQPTPCASHPAEPLIGLTTLSPTLRQEGHELFNDIARSGFVSLRGNLSPPGANAPGKASPRSPTPTRRPLVPNQVRPVGLRETSANARYSSTT